MARNKYVLNATSLSKTRSSWTQSKSHKTSIPFGKVVPLGAPIEVLPGDTFKLDMGAVIRMLTPKSPLMDSISGDIYAYFVPNRLVFDKSKEFFGQNESQAWTLNLQYNIPHIQFWFTQGDYTANGTTGFYYLTPTSGGTTYDCRGTLLDHFELPFIYLTSNQRSTIGANSKFSCNLLPFRGYQIIWNEDFRNPAVVDPALTWNYDHSDVTSFISNFEGFKLKPVMRYRDLFSSSLKSPQRGPSATIPLGSVANVIAGSSLHDMGNAVKFGNVAGFGGQNSTIAITPTPQTYDGTLYGSSDLAESPASTGTYITRTNLLVDLSTASAATVNTLRNSIAIQHLYEMMTNAFRYNEYTEVFFGVRGSDATLQRPQHLGGIHFRFNVNQVLSTAEGTNTTVGSTGAFGIAEVKGHVYTNSFTEHGYIYLLLVTRKEHTYVQGLDKLWRKREFLDVYQPPLANIGNVDIKNSELWFGFNSAGTALDDAAFSYTEPYYEYRYMVSKACGLMNPLAPGSLSYYSLTDVLASKPSLNSTFVSEDPNGLDNALFASANNVDQFFGDFYFRYQCSRVMPLYSIPGLNRI